MFLGIWLRGMAVDSLDGGAVGQGQLVVDIEDGAPAPVVDAGHGLLQFRQRDRVWGLGSRIDAAVTHGPSAAAR